jgi:hypothetical protein
MLSQLPVRQQYHLKISNRFAALENFGDSKGINRAGKILGGTRRCDGFPYATVRNRTTYEVKNCKK